MRLSPLVLVVVEVAACAPSTSTPVSAPVPATTSPAVVGSAPLPRDRRPAIPPIPKVTGPLSPRVVYPSANALVAARDSNFLLGSVGTGEATLTINGAPVRVEPNGAFVAWLPLPPRDAPRYELVVAAGADTQRLSHPIRFPATVAALPLEGRLVVDVNTVAPKGGLALRDDEVVRIGVVAPSNARVALQTAGEERVLANNGDAWSVTVPARVLRGRSQLIITRGADTVRAPIDSVLPPELLPLVVLGDSAAIANSDSDRVVIGRPVASETYKWFLLPGTVLRPTGRLERYTRVRLDQSLEIWLLNTDVRPLVNGDITPFVTAFSGRVREAPYGADLVIPVTRRPAFQVEERGNDVVLTLYGVQGTGDRVRYPGTDAFVRTVEWTQESTDRVVYTIHLSRPVFGYHVVWERNAIVLRLRKPPAVDARRPLAGVTITVDPGHPPAGATGPTGLYEGDAVLEVGKILRALLTERGATVVMTRTTRDTVALDVRPIVARRTNSHALVSIHLNALPDGANPLIAQGTETYFFHPHAEELARAIHIGMLRSMGLPDRGTFTRDLALARPTWMPSVLAEGAYIILADAEAALRGPEFQRLYALGLLEGLEVFFRSFAR